MTSESSFRKKSKMFRYAFIIFIAIGVLAFVKELIGSIQTGNYEVIILLRYAGLILLGSIGSHIITRKTNDLPTREIDYVSICLAAIVCVALWFSYPLNIIMSLYCVIAIIRPVINIRKRKKTDNGN